MKIEVLEELYLKFKESNRLLTKLCKISQLSDQDILGGYVVLKAGVTILIALQKNWPRGLQLFYPVNHEKELIFYPCMEISDVSLAGFLQSEEGEEFRGHKRQKMMRMKNKDVVEIITSYQYSNDSFDSPHLDVYNYL